MADKYPDNIEFEIERDALRKYLRTKSFLLLFISLGVVGVFFGTIYSIEYLGDLGYKGKSIWFIAKVYLLGIGYGLSISTLASLILYFVLAHRTDAKMANSISACVEGQFLRIKYENFVRIDRKLHFRSIIDYIVFDDPVMRKFGIMGLRMSTTAGGENNYVEILGLKDCSQARDILAEIDSLREKV